MLLKSCDAPRSYWQWFADQLMWKYCQLKKVGVIVRGLGQGEGAGRSILAATNPFLKVDKIIL